MNVNEILEKIEKIESELQSLKSMIKTSANNAEFAPVKAVTLPARQPVEIVEDEPQDIIDIYPESYNPDDFDIEDGILHEYLGDSEEVTIPDGVTKIGRYAFREDKTIKKVNFPNTITEISEFAFFHCDNLAEVRNVKNIIKIDDFAFQYCYSLERLRFSKHIEEIDSMAFYACENLSISIPETCIYCNDAFTGCKNVMIREVGE